LEVVRTGLNEKEKKLAVEAEALRGEKQEEEPAFEVVDANYHHLWTVVLEAVNVVVGCDEVDHFALRVDVEKNEAEIGFVVEAEAEVSFEDVFCEKKVVVVDNDACYELLGIVNQEGKTVLFQLHSQLQFHWLLQLDFQFH